MKLLVIILAVLIAIMLLLIWRIIQVNKKNCALIERQDQQISQIQSRLNSDVEEKQEEHQESQPLEVVDFSIDTGELNVFKDRISQVMENILSSTSENKAYKDMIVSLQRDIIENKDEKLIEVDEQLDLKYSEFITLLSNKYPQLSKNDLQLCVYLYEGISSKDIAEKMDKKVRSIESSRNRLRKKMNLEAGVDFTTVFSSIKMCILSLLLMTSSYVFAGTKSTQLCLDTGTTFEDTDSLITKMDSISTDIDSLSLVDSLSILNDSLELSIPKADESVVDSLYDEKQVEEKSSVKPVYHKLRKVSVQSKVGKQSKRDKKSKVDKRLKAVSHEKKSIVLNESRDQINGTFDSVSKSVDTLSSSPDIVSEYTDTVSEYQDQANTIGLNDKSNDSSWHIDTLVVSVFFLVVILVLLLYYFFRNLLKFSDADEIISSQCSLLCDLKAKERALAEKNILEPAKVPQTMLPPSSEGDNLTVDYVHEQQVLVLDSYVHELISICTFINSTLGKLQQVAEGTQKNFAHRKTVVKLKNDFESYRDSLLEKDFINCFNCAYPKFEGLLNDRFQSLTKGDIRLCRYLAMGLSTADIATLCDREVRTIDSSRNRLRKKLELPAAEDFAVVFKGMMLN